MLLAHGGDQGVADDADMGANRRLGRVGAVGADHRHDGAVLPMGGAAPCFGTRHQPTRPGDAGYGVAHAAMHEAIAGQCGELDMVIGADRVPGIGGGIGKDAVHACLQRIEPGMIGAGAGEPHGERLGLDAQFEDLEQLIQVERRHTQPALAALHQPLPLEPHQRLADRRA